MQNENHILAVWGSPNSGKTVISMKIASALAKQKKNVIVLLADNECPALPVVAPNETSLSLGALLTQQSISQETILQYVVNMKKHKYIGLLGYKYGDNVFSYSDYDKDRAAILLVLLRHIADYVIVDCSSMISSDILSTTALETADKVLRVGNCNLKSLSYFHAHLPIIEERKFNACAERNRT